MKAASLPLSIIIVGIGDADFEGKRCSLLAFPDDCFNLVMIISGISGKIIRTVINAVLCVAVVCNYTSICSELSPVCIFFSLTT